MKNNKNLVLTMFLCFFIFILNVHISAQNINHVTLENFSKSLECLMAGDFHNAILYSNMVIRSDPNSAINYVIRARAYYELNDYNRAIIDCDHAIRLDRNNSAAFTIRGNAYGQNGDLTRAISDWQAALRLNPNIEEARQNIELARLRQEMANAE
ncbi:MAG: tetratricopeptide repeat protein [Treponema sp.]|nr:tetratricopeptide repeat protein [Treponema sp.]